MRDIRYFCFGESVCVINLFGVVPVAPSMRSIIKLRVPRETIVSWSLSPLDLASDL